MRKSLVVGLCLAASFYGASAQNKTLGVGVATPNANAALHVESPTANQGFIMPRLTTAQREAMNALLTAADKGLMLYDTDFNTMFIWDGSAWKSSSQFAADASKTGDVINVLNQGSGVAGRFRTDNTKSKMPAIWAETNSDSALSAPIYGLNTGKGDVAASFRTTNPSTTFPALYAESFGTGGVGRFINNGGGMTVFANVKNTGHGLWSEHEGTNGYAAILQSVNASNPRAAVFVEAAGTGQSLWVQKSMATSTGEAFMSEHYGTSGSPAKLVIDNANNASPGISSITNGQGPAGLFEQTNLSVWYPALMTRSDGQGAAFSAISTTNSVNANAAEFAVQNTSNPRHAISAFTDGLGPAALINTNNAANSAPTVQAFTKGTGNAGHFYVDNAANPGSAFYATTNGTGNAIGAQTATGWTALHAKRDGAGNGHAGIFEILNADNQNPALQVNNAGNGSAGSFNNSNAGSGAATLFASNSGSGTSIQGQTASGFSAIYGRHEGINGSAGQFDIVDPTNSSPALQASTPGTGFAISARHSGPSGDAIYGEHTGGSGSAGNFRISNNLNTASALFAATNTPNGTAVGASHDNKGIAFAIWSGGIQVTTEVVTTASIANRASAYRITTGGTAFTLDFGPVNGEVFLIINETGQTITVSGGGTNITLLDGEGKTFIMFPGALRAF